MLGWLKRRQEEKLRREIQAILDGLTVDDVVVIVPRPLTEAEAEAFRQKVRRLQAKRDAEACMDSFMRGYAVEIGNPYRRDG